MLNGTGPTAFAPLTHCSKVTLPTAPGLPGALNFNQCQTGKFCLVQADCPAGFTLREGQARHSQVFVQ